MDEPNFASWGNALEERIRDGVLPHGLIKRMLQEAWELGRKYEQEVTPASSTWEITKSEFTESGKEVLHRYTVALKKLVDSR